jgi:Ca-activated chloride channel family protein
VTSFEWASPWWFLAFPAALVPWLALARPHTLRFSALVDPATGTPARRQLSARSLFHWLPHVLEFLAIALTVVALARPQLVRREVVRESDGIDILLAIDTSGSMREPDMGRGLQALSRLDAARLVMARFTESRPNDRVGLLLFGEEAFIQVPLTLDHDGLVDFIGEVSIGAAGEARTAVGDALAVAAKHMRKLDAPTKVVILVTDGRSNAGHVLPIPAAQAAAELGIHVYTIGVGGSAIDERTLGAVARITGGRYFQAGDVGELAEVYKEIDGLEKTTAKVKERSEAEECFLYALVPALTAFAGAWLLAATWLRRTP